MLEENKESVQLLNTAIIKSKEKFINTSYEERLAEICQSPVMKSLNVAIDHLAAEQKISRDQAAGQIVETVRALDSLWNDYVIMEGLSNLKGALSKNSPAQ